MDKLAKIRKNVERKFYDSLEQNNLESVFSWQKTIYLIDSHLEKTLDPEEFKAAMNGSKMDYSTFDDVHPYLECMVAGGKPMGDLVREASSAVKNVYGFDLAGTKISRYTSNTDMALPYMVTLISIGKEYGLEETIKAIDHATSDMVTWIGEHGKEFFSEKEGPIVYEAMREKHPHSRELERLPCWYVNQK